MPIVVIGGSAGALEAVQEFLRALSLRSDLTAFLVIHTPPTNTRILDSILARFTHLSVRYPVDGDRITAGTLYLAPPDHHLLVQPGTIELTRGPRENMFRPAIDPLFRTAAGAYGRDVIGVLLSGWNGDGSSGLMHIKNQGGVAIVQHPDEALAPEMPNHAIRSVAVDHIVRVREMPALIAARTEALGQPEVTMANGLHNPDPAETGTSIDDIPGPPSRFTCPDCGGALWEERDGELVRYHCHVGHAFSADTLVSAQSESVEEALWTALRVLEEGHALRDRMARRARERGIEVLAHRYEEDARNIREKADLIRGVITQHA